MSQIMTAVFFASQRCGRSRTTNRPAPVEDGTRSRRTRFSVSAAGSASPREACEGIAAKMAPPRRADKARR